MYNVHMSKIYSLPPPGGWPTAGEHVVPTPKKSDLIEIDEMLQAMWDDYCLVPTFAMFVDADGVIHTAGKP